VASLVPLLRRQEPRHLHFSVVVRRQHQQHLLVDYSGEQPLLQLQRLVVSLEQLRQVLQLLLQAACSERQLQQQLQPPHQLQEASSGLQQREPPPLLQAVVSSERLPQHPVQHQLQVEASSVPPPLRHLRHLQQVEACSAPRQQGLRLQLRGVACLVAVPQLQVQPQQVAHSVALQHQLLGACSGPQHQIWLPGILATHLHK